MRKTDFLNLFRIDYPLPEGFNENPAWTRSTPKPPALLSHQDSIESEVKWFILDSNNKISGPFQSLVLRDGWMNGKYPKNLKISMSWQISEFDEVSHFFPDLSLAFLYNPARFQCFNAQFPVNPDKIESTFLEFLS